MKEISYRTHLGCSSVVAHRDWAPHGEQRRDRERGLQEKPQRTHSNSKWALNQGGGQIALTSMQCRSCRTIAGCRKGNLFQFDVAKLETLDIGVETREGARVCPANQCSRSGIRALAHALSCRYSTKKYLYLGRKSVTVEEEETKKFCSLQ